MFVFSRDKFAMIFGDAVANVWFHPLLDALNRFNITQKDRIMMVLAQLGHESAMFTRFEENLNYSVAGLLKTFPSRIAPDVAEVIGRSSEHPADKQAIANLIYGKRHGNIDPDDGYRYRGRGPIQLTFKGNYRKASIALGINFTANPDMLLEPKYGALVAVWFMVEHNAINQTVKESTKRINGGYNGLVDRLELYDKIRTAWAQFPESTD